MTGNDGEQVADVAAVDELATRLFDAIANGDLATVRDCYAADAEIWHSNDQVVQTSEENLRTLEWMRRAVPGSHYTDVRRHVFPGGFVQQHVLRLTNRAGEDLAVTACIVATVRGGRIRRLDEYLDSVAVAAVMRK
jgi:ketosteroid isomerase-like protein